MLSGLFSQDQFSGIGLAQQVVLAVMLDNDPSLLTQQAFAVDSAICGSRGRRCVCFYWRCRAVIGR